MNRDLTILMVDVKDGVGSIDFLAKEVQHRVETFATTQSIHPFRFGISGYDSDRRALYQTPNVRKWCRQLYSKLPEIFLFLLPDTINWLYLCLAEIQVLNVSLRDIDPQVAQFLSSLPPQQRRSFEQQFAVAAIKLPPDAGKLTKQIFDHGREAIGRIAKSDKDRSILSREFNNRLEEGIPK